jgi:hypothetical protein
MGLYLPLNHGIPEVKVVVNMLVKILSEKENTTRLQPPILNSEDFDEDPMKHLSKNKIETD